MDRDKGSTDLDHIRAADARLQPCAVMESSIPVADGCVIAPEGDLEIIVVVVPDDGTFYLHGVASRLGIESHFTEIADLSREWRTHVKIELAEIEAARGPLLVRRGKIHVPKTANLQRRIVSLHLADRSLFVATFVLMPGPGRRSCFGQFRLWRRGDIRGQFQGSGSSG